MVTDDSVTVALVVAVLGRVTTTGMRNWFALAPCRTALVVSTSTVQP